MSVRKSNCILEFEKKIEKEKKKLRLGSYVSFIIFAIILLVLIWVLLEGLFDRPLGIIFMPPLYVLTPLFCIALVLFTVLKTDISSAHIIACCISDIAIWLEKDIRIQKREEILKRISEIKGELDLIYEYHRRYRRTIGQIRNTKAPFTGDIENFLNNIVEILKKISYIIKKECNSSLNPDFQNLRIDLNCLADELCKKPQGISTTAEASVTDILENLKGIGKDEDIFKSWYERVKKSLFMPIPMFLMVLLLLAVLILSIIIYPESRQYSGWVPVLCIPPVLTYLLLLLPKKTSGN